MTSPVARSIPWFACAALLCACSEPVPPAGEGAFYLQWVDSAGEACNEGQEVTCEIAGHEQEIGSVEPTMINELRKDTINGAGVLCSVTSGGQVEASIGTFSPTGAPIIQLDVLIDNMSSSATVDNPSFGSISYVAPETVKVFTSPPDKPCAFFLAQSTNEVAPGRLWVEFKCDTIANCATNSSCKIGTGRIAFQNCEQ